MDSLTHYLATALETPRRQREWGPSRLAEETGVSKAMLGQVERNESSPAVTILWKIVTGSNVLFSAFVSPSKSEGTPVFDPQQ